MLDKSANEIVIKNLRNEITKRSAAPVQGAESIFYASTGTLLVRAEDKVTGYPFQTDFDTDNLPTSLVILCDDDSLAYILYSGLLHTWHLKRDRLEIGQGEGPRQSVSDTLGLAGKLKPISFQIGIGNILLVETNVSLYVQAASLICGIESGILLLQVVLFDVQQRQTLGELNMPFLKYAVWNADASQVALLSKHAIIIADKKLQNSTTGLPLTSPRHITENSRFHF